MILATNNKGKLREIKEILNDFEIKSLSEAGIDVDVVEDEDTFYGNASKKAHEIYELAKEPVLADDSGLCIDALDGFPGVLTHRFLGEDKSDRERNLALLEKVKGHDRQAKVICDLVYYDGVEEIVAEGILIGEIASECMGNNGFGFDEIFKLSSGKTLAMLSSEEKNKVSARYLAAVEMSKKLRDRK